MLMMVVSSRAMTTPMESAATASHLRVVLIESVASSRLADAAAGGRGARASVNGLRRRRHKACPAARGAYPHRQRPAAARGAGGTIAP